MVEPLKLILMAKFKITFDVCYFGKTTLSDHDLYMLLVPGLFPAHELLGSFSDDNPVYHIINKKGEQHLILSFFLNAARHRGECLSMLCDTLADHISFWYERRFVCTSVDSTVLLLTPEGYVPPQND